MLNHSAEGTQTTDKKIIKSIKTHFKMKEIIFIIP